VDGEYRAGRLEHAATRGITFEVGSRAEGQKGLAPLARRRVVERMPGCRRLTPANPPQPGKTISCNRRIIST